tara:strand:+ start:4488 stop:5318 length:831 start_codon:yes stop_codon:yes gene_type:complete
MIFYIIPSPVGNLDDFTIRAINTIAELDFLAVESSHSAQKLLKKYNLKIKNLVIYNDHSTLKDRNKIINLLEAGKKGGIISEAGTPLISDPGYKLISSLIIKNIKIIPLPGPTSVIPALVGSGMPTDTFHFYGFLPKKTNEIKKIFTKCSTDTGTSIFFESSHRLTATLNIIDSLFGNQANICIAKEISKIHERFLRGTAGEILLNLNQDKGLLKGEFILMLNFLSLEEDTSVADKLFENLKGKLSNKELAKLSYEITGINKNFLYERFLSFSKKS